MTQIKEAPRLRRSALRVVLQHKRFGEQLADSAVPSAGVIRIGHKHRHILVASAELPYKLPAGAARGSAFHVATLEYDADSRKYRKGNLGHHFHQRRALGTDGEAVGSVLHVTAGKNFAADCLYRSAHQKFRVRRIGVESRLVGCRKQLIPLRSSHILNPPCRHSLPRIRLRVKLPTYRASADRLPENQSKEYSFSSCLMRL